MNNSVLETVTKQVTFRGQSLNVQPLRVGQIPPFARAIKPMFAALAGVLPPIPLGEGAGEGGDPPQVAEIEIRHLFNLIAEHGEEMIEAASIATRIAKKDIEDADPDDFISLVKAVVEVNADFFGRAMARAAAGAGTSPSSS